MDYIDLFLHLFSNLNSDYEPLVHFLKKKVSQIILQTVIQALACINFTVCCAAFGIYSLLHFKIYLNLCAEDKHCNCLQTDEWQQLHKI